VFSIVILSNKLDLNQETRFTIKSLKKLELKAQTDKQHFKLKLDGFGMKKVSKLNH
jgi:hypothetical protein